MIICDEPVSALDVSVQAQVMNLLESLQTEFGLSYVFIAHDLSVVRHIADRVAVMYLGEFVEHGDVDDIFENPQHPYTWGLLSSMPTLDTKGSKLYAIPGSPPDLLDPPSGDAFYPRNAYAMKIDTRQAPPFFDVSPTHQAATWLLAPGAPKVEPPLEIQRRQKQFLERQ